MWNTKFVQNCNIKGIRGYDTYNNNNNITYIGIRNFISAESGSVSGASLEISTSSQSDLDKKKKKKGNVKSSAERHGW
jgi:hypothetical protein